MVITNSRTLFGAPLRLTALVLGVLTLAAAGGTTAGAPVWTLIAAVAVPWVVLLSTRIGRLLAFAAVWLVGLWIVLLLLMVTGFAHLPMFLTVASVLCAIGLLGCVLLTRTSGLRAPSRSRILTSAPALLGSVVWLVVAGVNQSRSGGGALAWVMHGDAANELLFARGLTRSAGIVLGANENPVPLTSGLLALFIAPGRSGAGAPALLAHDMLGFAQCEILLIALTCVFAGLVAGSLARAARSGRPLVAVVAAAGSVLPLSWVFTTNPLSYGYIDAELALPIALACILVYANGRGHPLAVAGLQSIAATVLLSVWSPLVVLPIGLLAGTLIAHRLVLMGARGRALAFLVGCAVQLCSYGLLIELPSYFEMGGALQASGAIYDFAPSLFPSLAVIVLLLSLMLWRLVAAPAAALVGVLTVVGFGCGLGVLLYLSRGHADAWTYYPEKLQWIGIEVLLVLFIGMLPVLIVPWVKHRWARIVAIISVLSMVVVVAGAEPSTINIGVDGNPLVWISQEDPVIDDGGAAPASIVLATANLQHPRLYWGAGQPFESYLDYWLIEVASRSMKNTKLLAYAYKPRETSVAKLCAIGALMGARPTIYTRLPSLRHDVKQTCGSLRMKVVELAG